MNENTFRSYEGIPKERSGSSCAFYDGIFYVFGGMTNECVLDDLYSFKDNIWTKIKSESKPSARSLSAMCAARNRLFLFGGTSFQVENTAKNDLHYFDIEEEQWRVLPSKGPSDRYGHSLIYTNDHLILFGGVKSVKNKPQFLNDLWAFSLIDFTWKQLNLTGPAPNPRYRHTCVAIQNNVYIIGGTTNHERFGQIAKADLKEMRYSYLNLESHKKRIFKGRFGHASAVVGSQIYIYGGFDDQLCDDALSLDINLNQWSRKRFKGEIPPRDFFGFAASNDALMIIGGKNNNTRLKECWIWHFRTEQVCTLKKDLLTCDWRLLAPIRCPNYNGQQYLPLMRHYICTGEVTENLVKGEQLRDLLSFCAKMKDDYLLQEVVRWFLMRYNIESISNELNSLNHKSLVSIIKANQIDHPWFSSSFYKHLKMLRYEGGDIQIISGDQEYRAHSFILSSRCLLFKELLNSELKQNVTIEPFSKQVIDSLLDYLYFGSQGLPQQLDYLIQLYTAANYFLLTNEAFLVSLQEAIALQISQANLSQMIQIADTLNARLLHYRICQFIVQNLKKQDFAQFDKETLVQILQLIQ